MSEPTTGPGSAGIDGDDRPATDRRRPPTSSGSRWTRPNRCSGPAARTDERSCRGESPGPAGARTGARRGRTRRGTARGRRPRGRDRSARRLDRAVRPQYRLRRYDQRALREARRPLAGRHADRLREDTEHVVQPERTRSATGVRVRRRQFRRRVGPRDAVPVDSEPAGDPAVDQQPRDVGMRRSARTDRPELRPGPLGSMPTRRTRSSSNCERSAWRSRTTRRQPGPLADDR